MVRYKADYLILLVGTNPIPNYISAFGLANEGARIFLVHTNTDRYGFIGTDKIAENIKKLINIKRPDIDVTLVRCEKSGGTIADTIENIIEAIKKDAKNEHKSVHLNYTGGTKAMAAQAFYKVKSFEAEFGGIYNFVYSYIDSEKGRLIYDTRDEVDTQFEELKKISQMVRPTIEDICSIHGYKLDTFDLEGRSANSEILKDVVIKRIDGEEINEYKFDYIFLYDFDVCCVRKTSYIKKKDCKMVLFKLKDNATRICGDETKLCLICDIENESELICEVNNFYNTDVFKNIKIVKTKDGVVDRISEWINGR